MAECIEDFCSEEASDLLSRCPESFGTAALWEEAGVSPPPEIALMIELLHRASLQAENG